MNLIKTTFLLTALTVLLVLIGDAVGGQQGMLIALIVAAAMNFGAYWFSDKMVLSRYRAVEADVETAPELHAMVKRLADKAGMPMPKVYIIPSDAPNAFATGRDPQHAAVAATQGLLRHMTAEEVEGVMAHELSHVRHRDTLIGSIAATMAGAIMLLSSMARFGAIFGGRREGGGLSLLIVALVAPLAASLVQMAISRSREFAADRGAAEMTGNPGGLARALRRLEEIARGGRSPLPASPATAHLFIVNPLRGDSLARLFSTHPPTEERVRRLEEMAR